jgi:hypothetical protein
MIGTMTTPVSTSKRQTSQMKEVVLTQTLPIDVPTSACLPQHPEFVRWAFSRAGPPSLALFAAGDFSCRGRFIEDADLYVSVSPGRRPTTEVDQATPFIAHIQGQAIMQAKGGLTEDVRSFLGAAPIALFFGERHPSPRIANFDF